MTKTIIKVPADKSIKDVVCVVVVGGTQSGAGHFSTRVVHLTGTEKEKLNQYKEAFGVDWVGTPETFYTVDEQQEPTVSIELGKNKCLKNKATRDLEESMRKLLQEAKKYLAENEALKEKRATENKLVEAQLTE